MNDFPIREAFGGALIVAGIFAFMAVVIAVAAYVSDRLIKWATLRDDSEESKAPDQRP